MAGPTFAGRRGLRRIAFAILALMLLIAPGARAQAGRPVHLLLGGGVAFPNGTSPYTRDTGWQVQGALELARPGVAAGLRLEALFNRFGFHYVNPLADCAGPCPPERAHERTLAGIASLILQPRATRGIRVVPYLIAGAGLYRRVNSAVGATSGTEMGLNGGAGFRIPGMHAFLEAREHVVKNASNYLPVTVGVRF